MTNEQAGVFDNNNLTKINDRYSILHESASGFNMCLLGRLPYNIFPHLFTLNSTISLEKSNVNFFHRNPNFSLFGLGVLLGFVDTGIDYQHKAFLNRDGSSRIISIWDQILDEGTHPDHYAFGSEYKKDIINYALKHSDPISIVPTMDYNGHGTSLAGVAAGTPDITEDFSGVAPEAEFVIVKLRPANEYNRNIFSARDDTDCYLESDIMLGIEYIRNIAIRLSRPLVLCIGVGSSQGDHNGEGILPSYINNLASYQGLSFCISAGNEGINRRHYRGLISSPDYSDEFELHVGQDDKEFYFELWNHSPSRLTISISTPTGENTQSIYPRFDECREFNFVFESTVLYVNNIIMEEESGKQLILVRFRQAMAGNWKIKVINIDNKSSFFDVWLPSGSLITTETYFRNPMPDNTITSPGNIRSPLTVTAYNQFNNSIVLQSSRGYSSSNTIVPDIACPGFQLTSPLPGNRFGSATGTGVASAHAAGIQAMVMEWAILQGNYTTLTGRDITQLMIRGASQSASLTYPNTIWGYGRADVLGFFNYLKYL